MSIQAVLIILFAHFVGDFILQTDEQAKRKSKSNWWLTVHVSLYTTSLVLFAFILFGYTQTAIVWALYNGLIHWAQDFFTSRINAGLRSANQNHLFFVGIGADQFIHFCALLITYNSLQ